jgi:hypothetical protein
MSNRELWNDLNVVDRRVRSIYGTIYQFLDVSIASVVWSTDRKNGIGRSIESRENPQINYTVIAVNCDADAVPSALIGNVCLDR